MAGGCRRLSASSSRHAVDWERVDAELANVPEELADPAFDPLPSVIDILSQIEPEVKLAEVRLPPSQSYVQPGVA
eukprot:scaffold286086_cov27-Prasinocladus_malaysianus.AAC.1